MLKLIFLLVVQYLSVISGQTTLPYRVMEGIADSHIVTLSESEYMALNFETEDLPNYKYVFLSYPNDDDTLLNLEESSGSLTTARTIDRESYCAYEEYCYLQAEVGILHASRGPVDSVILQILLEDENDNAPFFQDSSIQISISEAAPIGSSRSLPQAKDKDSPMNGIDNDAYALTTDGAQHTFRIEYSNDELFLVLTENLDREDIDSYSLNLTAVDLATQPLSSSLMITIRVTDFNDHDPVFTQRDYRLEISEDYAVGLELLQVHASDEDIGDNGHVKYSFSEFTRITYGDIFDLDQDSGSISLIAELNYELTTVYSLEVLAQDQNADARVSTATVQITVLDVNDNRPRVQINTLTDGPESEVLERQPTGTLVAHVSVVDDDSGQNGNIACTLAVQRAFNLQAIPDSTQYKLITNEVLDRERQSRYSLLINCMDFGNPQLSQEATINVNVKDINDNTPRFTQDFYTASIPENNNVDAFILQVNASDWDSGENGRVTYSIIHSSTPNYIEIDSQTGVLRSAISLDYEDDLIEYQQIVLEVEARDHGRPQNAASTLVTINISDQNDQAPTFTESQYSFSVSELMSVGTSVGAVAATDEDSIAFNHFTFSLESNGDSASFTVDQSGVIYIRENLDRELMAAHRFHAYAIDDVDNLLRGSTEVIINIEDVNDNAPYIIYPVRGNRTVRISNKVPINYDIIQIRADDNDLGENANLIYELNVDSNENSNNRQFNIDRDVGWISTNKDFSSERYLETHSVVYVSDSGTPSHSAVVELTIIIDKNVEYRPKNEPNGQKQTDSKQANSKNVEIIVGLSVSTVVIVIVLVIAIILLRRKTKKNPQDAYIHTTIEQKPIPINAGNDLHSGKFTDENKLPTGSDDTLNSNQSNDSGKGSSETDNTENKQPGGIVLRTQRPSYNRSKSADRLSLSMPPSQQADRLSLSMPPSQQADRLSLSMPPSQQADRLSQSMSTNQQGTYLRPVTPRRTRAVSESSAQHQGIMPGSPLDVPDSMPLWHASYERMPSNNSGENVQLARSFARFSNGPSTPTSPATQNPHFQFPANGDNPNFQHPNNHFQHPNPNFQHPSTMPSTPTSPSAHNQHFQFPNAVPPYVNNNRQYPQLSSSVPTSPNALVGQVPFPFPLSLPPEQQRSFEGEDVYESYGSDRHNQSNQYMEHTDSNGHPQGPVSPLQYQSLHGPFHDEGGHLQQDPHRQFHDTGDHILQELPMHQDAFDLSGHMGQVSQQYLDQSGQFNSYSPNHYTQIHYPESSTNPTDVVV